MIDYYDIVLGLIPVSLAGLTALLFLAGMSLPISITLASTVTLGLIGHAMFVNGPAVSKRGSNAGMATESTQSNRLSAE